MGGFTYALNRFVVFQCASSVMLCYAIHQGTYLIVTSIKCYVVLQHSWRCTLYCDIFPCSRCVMVRFINLFSCIIRFNRSAFIGFQHASRVRFHYDIYEGSYWIATFLHAHTQFLLCCIFSYVI